MKSTWRYSRFIIAGIALLTAFALSVRFSDRGWQFDVDKGGSPVMAGPEGGYNLAGGDILNKVLLQMKEKYVDPTRIDPNRMLTHGLDEIQKTVPEIVVTFDKDLDSNPTSVKVQVDTQVKTFRIGKFESLWEMSFKMKDVFRFIQDNLKETEQLKFSDIEYAAINGMLNTLDPHSVLLTPQIYQEMQTQTGGKFGGLGIVIGVRDGALTVISPIDDTPASKAGIKAGDKITRIDDESTVNMSLNDAVSTLRGDPDTTFSFWVNRKGWSDSKKIELTRAIIKIESVESHMLGQKIGYVKIKSFQANTYSDLRDHLDKLNRKSGGINGLVLDMRTNPGGLLDQAIKISDTFLSAGTIVSTVGFGNKLRDENKARDSGTEPPYPIIVLVDPGSASAAEIVAGALKNHNRALIVGDTTFGKGSVQIIYELMDGSALKLTIAQYLTPGDVSIQSVGIVPDIKIIPVTADDKGVDMFLPSHIMREADLDAHLDHSSVRQSDKPGTFVRYFKEREAEFDPEAIDDEKFVEDFAIRFGQRLLTASNGTSERNEMLKKLEATIQREGDKEMDVIADHLKKIGIDWTAGQNPDKLNLDVQITTDQPNNTVQAGDKIKITAKVTNKGDAPIFRLRAQGEADGSSFEDREFIFGKVDPGQEREFSVEVEVPKHHETREDQLVLNFGAHETNIALSKSLILKTQGRKRPHFAFTYALDDGESGDGVLQPDETVTMRLNVTNTGDGDAEKTSVYLRNMSDSALFLTKGKDEAPAIPAGKTHTFLFTFDVKAIPADPMKVEVEIYDEVFKVLTSEEIVLLAEPAGALKVEAAKGTFVPKQATSVLVAARSNASTLANAPAGAALKVIARTSDMIKVQLSPAHTGWVLASAGQFNKGGVGPDEASLKPHILRAPPTLTFNEDLLSTSRDSFHLTGVAADDSAIKDYYVFVYSTVAKRSRFQKVSYKRGGDATLKIDEAVPLHQGMNRIRIFVRDSDDMITDRTLFVFKK